MNIALIAHDRKKELMVQFCMAYCGILAKHNICATGTTGSSFNGSVITSTAPSAGPSVNTVSDSCVQRSESFRIVSL